MLKSITETSTVQARCEAVRFTNVSLELNTTTLIDKINFQLASTGRTVVIGANGAGKSLMLRLLARLIKPTSGTIQGGVSPQNQTPGNCQSLVFQSPVLLRRSAFENIAFLLRHFGYPKSEIADHVTQALEQVGLADLASNFAHSLSGGEQQRLALARALIIDPSILLLDEPTANLDPTSTAIVEDLVFKFSGRGTKVVHVTHDIKQAKRLADEILFMHEGRSMVLNEARAFFDEPGCEEAQAFLDGRIP